MAWKEHDNTYGHATPDLGHEHCTRACCREIYRKNGHGHLRGHRFVQACAVEMHMDKVQQPFGMEIYNKTTGDTSGDIVLCKPAQSKCTWTCHKRHYVRICAVIYRENAGPVSRDTRFVRACAVEMHMDMSQDAFCAEIYRENAGGFRYHLDWTPGLNCYRKNPSVWPHCLGMFVE